MLTYERNFVREFKTLIRDRKQQVDKSFRLQDILVPHFETLIQPSEERKLAFVKGVTEPYFDGLNNETVEVLGRVKLYKSETLSDGSIRRDRNGQEVKQQVVVPQDSIAILTTVNIRLPNYVPNKYGENKKVKPTKGYAYVRYLEQDGKRKYIYIIPRDYVYLLNVNALVITPNKRRQYYLGYKMVMQDGNTMYIYVIPYKLRAQTEIRVLGVKANCDFRQEIQNMLRLWVEKAIVFNPRLTALPDGSNMGYVQENPTLYVEDYTPVTASLKEDKEMEL